MNIDKYYENLYLLLQRLIDMIEALLENFRQNKISHQELQNLVSRIERDIDQIDQAKREVMDLLRSSSFDGRISEVRINEVIRSSYLNSDQISSLVNEAANKLNDEEKKNLLCFVKEAHSIFDKHLTDLRLNLNSIAQEAIRDPKKLHDIKLASSELKRALCKMQLTSLFYGKDAKYYQRHEQLNTVKDILQASCGVINTPKLKQLISLRDDYDKVMTDLIRLNKNLANIDSEIRVIFRLDKSFRIYYDDLKMIGRFGLVENNMNKKYQLAEDRQFIQERINDLSQRRNIIEAGIMSLATDLSPSHERSTPERTLENLIQLETKQRGSVSIDIADESRKDISLSL